MKKYISVIFLSLFCGSAYAEWEGGISYIQLDEDVLGISPSAIGFAIGYRNQQEGSNFALVPEFRIGIGVSDDSINFLGETVDIKVNHLWSVSLRAVADVSDSAYLWIQPAYTNLDVEASIGGIGASEDEGDFGFGAGLGIVVQGNTSVELSFESYDGTDGFLLGLRTRF